MTIKMQSQKKNILEDVMPLRIIREVEKWPVIYKKDNLEMANSHFKYKVWEEVAKNLFDNYQNYTAAEKQVKVSNLMKKWRNLRDTFKRQLMVEKKNREGYNIKKKQYVYFKHMSFLLPHMSEDAPAAAPETARAAPKRRRRERALLTPSSDIDEDKHFLLSLLPSFRRMSENDKLTVKMEILKVIKDVKNSSLALDEYALDELPERDDGDVVVKEEPLTVRVADYRARSDSDATATDTD